MAIALAQAVTTGVGNLTLNGVVAGNALVSWMSYRRPTTGLPPVVPTDSVGAAFAVASAPTPAIRSTTIDVGVAIHYKQNAEAGTHTVTFETETQQHQTLAEWSGLATTGLFDVEANAKTENSAHTSQVTGTTATTAQADELVCIAHAMRAGTGAADVGYTNPVSGFTTHQILSNDAANVTTFHATQVVSSTGTQTATFNWTASEATMSSQACIATFKGAGATVAQTMPGIIQGANNPMIGLRYV